MIRYLSFLGLITAVLAVCLSSPPEAHSKPGQLQLFFTSNTFGVHRPCPT
jgi:hypothetical protein